MSDKPAIPESQDWTEQDKVTDRFLLQAVKDANTARIDLCLKKGADINAKDGDGRTPVTLAVISGAPSLVRFLLARRPDLFLRDNNGSNGYDYLRTISSYDARKEITDLMLSALPDHTRNAATPVEAAAIAEKDFNEAAEKKPALVVRTVTFPQDDKKDDPEPKKPGRSGFEL